MNRGTALFVALAILLGHALAIHTTAAGQLAPPYDIAYVAFRIGRNFAQQGDLAWTAGVSSFESYPSLLWIGVCAAAERLFWSVQRVAQNVGFISASLCVLTLAQFSPVRLAGVIAPLLFVASGTVAATALSGLETATLGLLVTFSFLAYERGWRAALAVSLALCALARPQGLVFALALLAIEILRRAADALRRQPSQRATLWPAFAAPLLVGLGIGYLRMRSTGHWSSAWVAQLVDMHPRVVSEGGHYVLDFLTTSGSGALFVFPLWYWIRRGLSGVGVRACALTLVWSASVALGGGGFLPFNEAMAPIYAVLLVAVQEAMQTALDSKRRFWPTLTWVLFTLGLLASALASKFPGDIGPLKTATLHRAWVTPHTAARFGYTEELARVGLAEEILATERLREIGLFLRDNVAPDATVLTPWPGAIGYLSGRRVLDPLGRTSPSPGETRTRAWEGFARADVVKALGAAPDYVLPSLRFGESSPNIQEVAQEWIQSLDLLRERGRQRALQLRSQFAQYELITVPLVGSGARAGLFPLNRFRLLRRIDLGLAPQLELKVEGRRVRVEIAHRTYPQLADLRLEARHPSGAKWQLRPNGEWVEGEELVARSNLMLFHTGERRIRALEAEVPVELGPVELVAVLRNPGALDESLFSSCSKEATARVE